MSTQLLVLVSSDFMSFQQSDGDGSAPPERTSDTDVSHPDRVMSLGSSTLGANAPPQQGMSSATSGSSLGVGHRREGGRVVKSGYCVKQGHVVSCIPDQ